MEEFRAYVRYARTVTSDEAREILTRVTDEAGGRLETGGRGFRLAVKYYLPRLLLAPVTQLLLYRQYALALLHTAPAREERESFKQVRTNKY